MVTETQIEGWGWAAVTAKCSGEKRLLARGNGDFLCSQASESSF